ncbi:MAG: hypothetical protein ACXWF9_09665, partial [Solirubrobacterales bacterium]
MTEARRSLLLVHVRKTGGTSLGGALGNRFPANECLSLYDREPPSAEHPRRHSAPDSRSSWSGIRTDIRGGGASKSVPILAHRGPEADGNHTVL